MRIRHIQGEHQTRTHEIQGITDQHCDRWKGFGGSGGRSGSGGFVKAKDFEKLASMLQFCRYKVDLSLCMHMGQLHAIKRHTQPPFNTIPHAYGWK